MNESPHRWLPAWRTWAVLGVILVFALLAVAIQWLRAESLPAAQRLEAHVYAVGNVAFRHPVSFRVFVRDAQTNLPVAGARVVPTVGSRRNDVKEEHVLPPVTTGADGVASFGVDLREHAVSESETVWVVAAVSRGLDGDTVMASIQLREQLGRVHLVTDKPRYQPGQVMHIRALALGDGERPRAGAAVLVQVLDGRSNQIFERRITTSPHGLAAVDFDLADRINLGDYEVRATLDDRITERRVKVEQYTLPKFKVAVALDPVGKGTEAPVSGVVSAQYTFGRPVVGARVVVSSGEERIAGATDEHGELRFRLDRALGQVVAEVSGAGIGMQRETVTLDSASTQHGDELRVVVLPEASRFVRGVTSELYVVAAYPDGTPAQVTVQDPTTEQVVRTSEYGVAKLAVTPSPTADWSSTRVVATDGRGRDARNSVDVPVATWDGAFVLRAVEIPEPGVLAVRADSVLDGPVFVDVLTLSHVIASGRIDVASGTGAARIPVPEDARGLLLVNGYRIKSSGQVFEQHRTAYLPRGSALDVDWRVPPGPHPPGARVPIDLRVTEAGQPRVAALSLVGVDDAVLTGGEEVPGSDIGRHQIEQSLLDSDVRRMVPALTRTLEPANSVAQDARDARDAVLAAAELRLEPPRLPVVDPWGHESTTRTDFVPHTWHWRGYSAETRVGSAQYDASEFKQSVAAAFIWGFGLVYCGLMLLLLGHGSRRWRRPARPELRPEARLVLGRVLTQLHLSFAGGLALLGTMLWTGNELVIERAIPLAYLLVALVTALLVNAAYRLEQGPWTSQLGSLPRLAWTLVGAHVALYLAAYFMTTAVLRTEDEDYLFLGGAAAVLGGLVIGVIAAATRAHLRPVGPLLGLGTVVGYLTLTVGGFCGVSSAAMQLGARYGTARDLEYTDAELIELQEEADNKEGGTGIRSKGEEGSMGSPSDRATNRRYAVQGPGDAGRAVGELTRGRAQPARVREYFPETLLWKPEIITDAQGRARLDLELADSITTWRLGATAVTAQGALGASTTRVQAFQDFFVSLEVPEDLTQGDEVTVPLAVFNYLDQPQNVRLEFEPGRGLATPDGSVELDVGANDVASAVVKVVARGIGRDRLRVRASGTRLADAVERSIEVHPDGHQVAVVQNGRIEAQTRLAVMVPEAHIAGTARLDAKVYPSVFSQVAEGLRGVFVEPHGCFEQTSSTTYPSVLALDYLRRAGEADPELEAEAGKYIAMGYQRLVSFEVKRSGGFSLFGEDPADVALTAYGLMEFVDMARVHPVDTRLIERTRQFLRNQAGADGTFGQAGGSGRAVYAAWALAEAGDTGQRLDAALEHVARSAGHDNGDPYELALRANALLAGGKHDAARPLLGRLSKLRVAGEAFWASEGNGIFHSYGRGLNQETTALVALAFLRADHDTQVARRALEWLVAERNENGTWASTPATGAAMRALLVLGATRAGEERQTATLSVNGHAGPTLTLDSRRPSVYRQVALSRFLEAGTNAVVLESTDPGTLGYQVVSEYFLPWEVATLQSAPDVDFDVDYSPRRVAAGEVITCRVRLEWRRDGEATMPMAVVGIPPGVAVATEDLAALKQQRRLADYAIERRHVTLYLPDLAGRTEFELRLRTRLPGRVQVPASHAYPYYEPEARTETAPVDLTVL